MGVSHENVRRSKMLARILGHSSCSQPSGSTGSSSRRILPLVSSATNGSQLSQSRQVVLSQPSGPRSSTVKTVRKRKSLIGTRMKRASWACERWAGE